jgi:hypothetical protein
MNIQRLHLILDLGIKNADFEQPHKGWRRLELAVWRGCHGCAVFVLSPACCPVQLSFAAFIMAAKMLDHAGNDRAGAFDALSRSCPAKRHSKCGLIQHVFRHPELETLETLETRAQIARVPDTAPRPRC